MEANGRFGSRLEIGTDGAARLELLPSAPAGRIRLDDLRTLPGALDRVAEGVRDSAIRFLVVSAGGSGEMNGYDPAELESSSEDEVIAWSHEAQGILRRFEELEIPSIAVLEASWTGAAAEIALACDHRVAARGARIAFTQTRAGLAPGWGGTVRLPRVVGLAVALDLLLTGRAVEAREARRIGLVDRVVDRAEIERGVERIARRAGATARGEGRRRRGLAIRQRLVEDTPLGRRALGGWLARRRRLAGDLPARLTLDLVLETYSLAPERAYARESAVAARLAVSTDTRSRMHSRRAIDRLRSTLAPAPEIRSAAVLGSSRTAGDIAHLLVSGGLDVRMKAESRPAARRGVGYALERIAWEEAQETIGPEEAAHRRDRLEAVTGFGGFGTLDLLVAVGDSWEEPASLHEVAQHVGPGCVFVVHDWEGAARWLEAASRSRVELVGVSPAFPAERFPLLEIVALPGAGSDSIAALRRLADRLEMVAVEVRSAGPTPAARLLAVWFAEAARLLEEGATVAQVDAAMEEFGFSVGPFRRIDAIGARRALEMSTAVARTLGHLGAPPQIFKRIGSEPSTFYRYRRGVPGVPNPTLPPGLSPGGPKVTSLIRRRLLLVLVNEAARIVQEGVATPADLDVISIVGLGFPESRGGLLYHADVLGAATLVEDLRRAASRFGARYEPVTLLEELADRNEGFHRREARSGQG
jgi:enoyl-CoA hydratase/carnithine racemase/3-hydroxyacyl-CoA dehydrogenase